MPSKSFQKIWTHLKKRIPLNKRKKFKCVFNNLFQQNIKEKGRVINQSNLQHIYQTLTSSQIERKINQTEFDIPGSTDTSTAIFEELASVYVEYFLNVERGQASLYGTFASSVYEHLDKTAEEIMDLIAPFSAFYERYKCPDPSNKIKMGAVEPGVSGVLNAKGQLNRMEISHLLKSHVHSFVPSFYKQFNQTIGTYEFKRIERKSTISFKNIAEKEELPLQLNKEKYARNPSKAELKLEEKYRKEFKKALKARNEAFNTPRTQEDLVSIDHKRARNGLAVLYAAYTKFEDTKIDLRDKYQAEYDLLLLAPETILPSTSDREATNATTQSPLRMIDQVAELIDSAAMPEVAELDGNSAAIVGVELDTLTMSATTPSTAEERKERKPKRWHERGDDSDMQQARAPAATTSIFETTYLYTEQAEWPEWIKALKSDRQFDESAILRGFTSTFADGGLGGTIFEDNNKYLLMFESPFNKDILPKNRFYTAKAHALHKGTGDKRYPAIRKALIEMLEEAHIIPR